MPLSCRFYAERFPEIDDVVMVNVRNIEEMGAYVHILEYNNIEGMILLSELSRRRIRSVNKLIRVGQTEPAVVIRVNKIKGYIDLSKRRVAEEDIAKCAERFGKAKAVNSILRHVAEVLNFESDAQFEELYQKTAWFYEERMKKKASAYDFFKQAIQDPSILAECGLDENTQNALLNNIKQKLSSQALKIRADIECACYGYEGIDAVKTALRAGLACSTEELPIKINLISPPLYESVNVLRAATMEQKKKAWVSKWITKTDKLGASVTLLKEDTFNYFMTTATPAKENGLKALQTALEEIDKTIKSLGGVFKIQMAPKVVTANDDANLAKKMEKAALDNAEISGDSDRDDNKKDEVGIENGDDHSDLEE